MSTRKPRSDSKLDGLDMDQQRQLCEWLLTPGLSYELVKKMVFSEFNVSTNASSLSAFYQSYCAPYLLKRRMEAAGVAQEVADEAARTPGQFDTAAIDALRQKAFEFASNPMCNPKDVDKFFKLLLKANDQELKRKDIEIKVRRLALLEASAEQARVELQKLKDPKSELSDTDRAAIVAKVDEILGVK